MNIFERFTDTSRKVMGSANREAQRLNHEYIGSEHILLGLIKEEKGLGYDILKSCEIDIMEIRKNIHKEVRAGPEMVTMGKLPQTPRAKVVIEHAIKEARSFGHNYIGTEHILLGLMLERDSIAFKVLHGLGLSVLKIEQYIKLVDELNTNEKVKIFNREDLHRFLDEAIKLTEESDFDIMTSFSKVVIKYT